METCSVIKQKIPAINPKGDMPGLKIGGYLLSRVVCSTIGANGLNFSVRNGKRWYPAAIVT